MLCFPRGSLCHSCCMHGTGGCFYSDILKSHSVRKIPIYAPSPGFSSKHSRWKRGDAEEDRLHCRDSLWDELGLPRMTPTLFCDSVLLWRDALPSREAEFPFLKPRGDLCWGSCLHAWRHRETALQWLLTALHVAGKAVCLLGWLMHFLGQGSG